MELLSQYQIANIIFGTIYFILLFMVYKIAINDITIFDILYSSVAFLISYTSVNIIYNYTFFMDIN